MLTCVITVLALAVAAYVWHLLTSSAGVNFDYSGEGIDERACPAVLAGSDLSGTPAEDCVASYTRTLSTAVLLAIPATALAAVALTRWINHMGFAAKPLRIG